MNKEQYLKQKRKLRLFEYLRSKPQRDFQKALDNLKLEFRRGFISDVGYQCFLHDFNYNDSIKNKLKVFYVYFVKGNSIES
jgi:hypothetical protein